ncbi:uncharacterized protein MEPE_01581 [Melanopsichium pennsylvanicum]|uniref:Uncharacterized protein n=2 Tax=Melanopsichium pennsylvanicum TaxID=63383 RepID=A0AAJ5C3R0_9BASI|nr:hypothetical protein BN887_03322 [Melanopsichium pennsylvanicum 4]SNX82875.1 uncharacterized protein MEPE_01581 [Melanopsichium pennsylvanicum]
MLWHIFIIYLSALLSTAVAAEPHAKEQSPASSSTGPSDPLNSNGGSSDPNVGDNKRKATQQASASVFGAGCRWDPTTSNIEQVTFKFRTGEAPPSTWFADLSESSSSTTSTDSKSSSGSGGTKKSIHRRDGSDTTQRPIAKPDHVQPAIVDSKSTLLDASYHTRLIDVLTFRARFGSFGSSLNSAGCALPAFSERLATLEAAEQEIVNKYAEQRKPLAGSDDVPNAMFFWAGISNYDPEVRTDLIQTVVFYGDGCAANPRQGLCVYAAEYSNFRYNPEDHMCMGSNMPAFYPINTDMTVVYRTQNGFRTQESWIDGKMISYLRSAGDQFMNSFVITQECKTCTWPVSEQVYSDIRIQFSEPEPEFDALGLCTGGAVTTQPRMADHGKMWIIDEVRVPSGKHLTSAPDETASEASADVGGESKTGVTGTSGSESSAGTPGGSGTRLKVRATSETGGAAGGDGSGGDTQVGSVAARSVGKAASRSKVIQTDLGIDSPEGSPDDNPEGNAPTPSARGADSGSTTKHRHGRRRKHKHLHPDAHNSPARRSRLL